MKKFNLPKTLTFTIMQIIIFAHLLIDNSTCFSQSDSIGKIKDAEVLRLRKEIASLYNNNKELIRSFIIDSAKISEEELDSLIINIRPICKISEDYLQYEDSLYSVNYDSTFHHYRCYIKLPANQKTVYPALKINDKFDNNDPQLRLYSKDSILKYYLEKDYKEGKSGIAITKYYNKLPFSKLNSYEKYILFYFDNDDLNNSVGIIFNNRIYSIWCLNDKEHIFSMKNLEELFKSHPKEICDCDIDVYLIQHLNYKDYKKQTLEQNNK